MAFLNCAVVGGRRAASLPATSRAASSPRRVVAVTMKRGGGESDSSDISRRQALAALLALGGTALASIVAPNTADAAPAGGFVFPKAGYNAPPAAKPGDLQLDEKTLKQGNVQDRLKKLRGVREQLQSLEGELAKNPQLNVNEKLKQIVDVSQLRDELNTINEVFDEDTQLKTDRVVRGIIQDVNDLTGVAVVKKGAERTPKKAENTSRRLAKLSGDIDKLLQFYP